MPSGPTVFVRTLGILVYKSSRILEIFHWNTPIKKHYISNYFGLFAIKKVPHNNEQKYYSGGAGTVYSWSELRTVP
jgi:hypothetical protein